MSEDRIHRAVSADGPEIAGRVYGQGPPLVLVHGSMGDGDLQWEAMLPLLTDRFTCFLPSTRGRGLSGSHPERSRQAGVGDVTAFVESIGEPVALVGVSWGGMLVLGAAARTRAITAVAALEPFVYEAMSEDYLARFRNTVEHMAEQAEQGRTRQAVEAFMGLAANEQEQAALSEMPEAAIEEVGQYLQIDLAEFREVLEFRGPSPTAPSSLAQISAPVLLLHYSRTSLSYPADGARYAAEHIPDATVRELEGLGHLAHFVAPEPVADELIAFFEASRAAGIGGPSSRAGGR